MHLIVDVTGSRNGYRMYGDMLASLVAYQHLGIYTGRISLVAFGGRQSDGHCFLALGRQVDDKCKFIRTEVAIQIIQLRRYFFASVHDYCRTYPELWIDFTEFDYYRFVRFCLVPGVTYFHLETLLGFLCFCCDRKTAQ